MIVRIAGFHMSGEESLDVCVKKVQMREKNGVEWMLLDTPCSCVYLGEAKVFYCRKKSVYFAAREADKNQFVLPYVEDKK